MSTKDVERFVGLLVSDDEFVEEVKKDFHGALESRCISLDQKEAAILRESIDSYVHETQIVVPGGSVMAVGAAVAAAVAASVAANVATKVVDKLMDGKIVTPLNMRLRELLINRKTLERKDFDC